MEWFGRNPVGSIKTAVSPLCGNHDTKRARTGLRPSRFSPRLRQATDLAVAQAVVTVETQSSSWRPCWSVMRVAPISMFALTTAYTGQGGRCSVPICLLMKARMSSQEHRIRARVSD
jgi:hypothetical protein